MSTVHTNEEGVIFQLTIRDETGTIYDVSTSSKKVIFFIAPDGTSLKKTAAFTTDGTDGKIQYTTLLPTEIAQAGRWTYYANIQMTADLVLYSSVASFDVVEPLATE